MNLAQSPKASTPVFLPCGPSQSSTPGAGAGEAAPSQWAANGGPEIQREIGGGGGGLWQNDNDGMEIGTAGVDGAMEHDFDPHWADGGGAAEEIDQEEAGDGRGRRPRSTG